MKHIISPYHFHLLILTRCISRMTGKRFTMDDLAVELGFADTKALFGELRSHGDNITLPMAQRIHALYPLFRIEWQTGESEAITIEELREQTRSL